MEIEKDDFELDELGHDFQPHRTDDPDVWGLVDVARGRTPTSPVTIYKVAGDSASSVVGRLTPEGVFTPIPSSNVGTIRPFQDGGADDGQILPKGRVLPFQKTIINAPVPTIGHVETKWDGAVRNEPFTVITEDGVSEERQDHSRGLLLGSYQTRVQIDRGKEQTPGHRKHERERCIHPFQHAGVAQTYVCPVVGKRRYDLSAA